MGEMLVICVWFVCSMVSLIIAAGKGRGGYSWFFMGLLLGPFTLLAAMAMPENREQMAIDALESGDRKRCPHCDEIVRKKAVVCRYCARDIPEIAADHALTE